MTRPRVIIISALLVTLTGAAGCSSGHEGSPSASTPSHPSTPFQTPTPDQAMITWLDSVCSADKELQATQGAARTAALTAVIRQGTPEVVASFIAVLQRQLAENLAAFQKLRTGAVNGGDRVIDAYITAMNEARTKLDGLERAANDPAQSSPADLARLAAKDLNLIAPVDTDLPRLVHADQTLQAAYQRADNCKDAKPLTTANQQPAPTASQ